VGCFGSASVYMCVVMEQGAWAFIKGVFKKICSTLFWQRRNLRWPDTREACLVQIRVITINTSHFAITGMLR
jgi:hypothetical protein